jgi:hypothetical protein
LAIESPAVWYRAAPSMNAKFRPLNPASANTVKSVLFGSARYTSTIDESPRGSGTVSLNRSTSRALSRDVSNISDGPLTPRASKFSTTPPSRPSGCSRTKASAPSRPFSSPSVISSTTSLRSRVPPSARTVSSMAATAAPSSAAPGPIAAESWCAASTTVPDGSVPGSVAMTLSTRPKVASPSAGWTPTACRTSTDRPAARNSSAR